MAPAYRDLLAFVQHLAPTWRKTQHNNFAQLLTALLERPTLCLSDLARALPNPEQPLHGRLKRLMRFLDNPRLDEAALFLRWLKLTYRFGEDLPQPAHERPLLPVLLDTTYFDPFALLVAMVPCGSRGLPVLLATYHRQELIACLPTPKTWPDLSKTSFPPPRPLPASAVPTPFLSQNHIEEQFLDYLFALLSPALRSVIVADRGFARASLFTSLQQQGRDFVIRFDAKTHIRLPAPVAPGRPLQGPPEEVLGLRPGQRRFFPEAFYGQQDQVPIRLLAIWEQGHREPWYLATSLEDPEQTERLYRWRMRLECTNRDEKTGVLLREGGDQHAIRSLLHMHRLLLALAAAQWLLALLGLEAWRELPMVEQHSLSPEAAAPRKPTQASCHGTSPSPPVAAPLPPTASQSANDGPAAPPPVVPHRGPSGKLPIWMRPFAARGPLSYVRLGLEVLRSPKWRYLLRRLLQWLADYLWPWTPLWRPWQLRYRHKHWWMDSS